MWLDSHTDKIDINQFVNPCNLVSAFAIRPYTLQYAVNLTAVIDCPETVRARMLSLDFVVSICHNDPFLEKRFEEPQCSDTLLTIG